jgi:hypothetical protein
VCDALEVTMVLGCVLRSRRRASLAHRVLPAACCCCRLLLSPAQPALVAATQAVFVAADVVCVTAVTSSFPSHTRRSCSSWVVRELRSHQVTSQLSRHTLDCPPSRTLQPGARGGALPTGAAAVVASASCAFTSEHARACATRCDADERNRRRVEGARERYYARAMLSQLRGAHGVLALRYGRAVPRAHC